jgi:hypothetical protein
MKSSMPPSWYALMGFWLLCCTSASAQSPAGTSVSAEDISAEDISAEELLAAVKHVLVDAALDETVNVTSSAYIDSQGQLIESSFFDTSATVRGVRMLEYLPQAEPVRSPESDLPASLSGIREGVCAIHAGRFYTPALLVSSDISLGHGRISDAMVHDIRVATQRMLDHSVALNGQWQVIHQDERIKQLNAYERVMTGLQPFEQAQYELRWTVTKQPYGTGMGFARRTLTQGRDYADAAARRVLSNNPVTATRFNARSQALAVQFSFELIDRLNGDVLRGMQTTVNLSADAAGLLAERDLPATLATAMAPQLEAFFTTLSAEYQCQLNRFAILGGAGDGSDDLRIMLGASGRARLGDRFLLAQTPWQGGDQVFNSNLISSLSIGEIIHLDSHQSVIRIIAGNGTVDELKYAVPF